MRRLASEVLRELETRVARLEKQSVRGHRQMYRRGPMPFEETVVLTLREIAKVGHDMRIGVHLGNPYSSDIRKDFKKVVGFKNGQPYVKNDTLPIYGGFVDLGSYTDLASNKFWIKIYLTKITDRQNFDLRVEVRDLSEKGLIARTYMSNKTAKIQAKKLFEQVESARYEMGLPPDNWRTARLERTSATYNTDEEVIGELELSIVNESRLYPMVQQIISNQARHMLRGRWSQESAIKAFENLVVAGIKMYRQEHGNYILPPRISRSVKQAVAKTLFEYYEDNINEAVEDLA